VGSKSKQKRSRDSSKAASGTPESGEPATLSVLLHVSQMVGGTLELGKVIRSAMDAAAGAMNAEACSVLLRSEDTGGEELDFYIAEGPSAKPLQKARVPVNDESVAGWVAGHGQALLVPDTYKDSRFDPTYDALTGFHTRNMVCAPLLAKGRQLGVIQIINRLDGKSFDDHDLELLKAVASLVAVAIYTAEEHEERLKAERLAVVGRAVAGLAHCVKNILNSLQFSSYMLDQSIPKDEKSAPTAVRGWNILKRNLQFLSDVVLDMLSYSKKRKPLLQQCQVNDTCRDVAGLLAQQAAEREVTLETRLSDEVSDAWIDEAGIKRCLINLAGNAIEACEEKGEVCIETRPSEKEGWFEISVSDDGCGIDADCLKKIFDPLFSTKGEKGTGLGLAVTKKIVEEHGGGIDVESTPGRGTRFTLVLPVRHAKDEERAV
jgi:signal transduction histidine kinase